MATQAVNIADLMAFTLSQYRKKKWTDYMSGYQKTIAFKQIFTRKKAMGDDGGGVAVTFNILMDTNGSFRFVGLYFLSVLAPPAQVVQGSIPWRGWTYNWSVDGAEPKMNSGSEQIVDILKTRYFQAVGDMVKGTEQALWRVPAITDDESVFGIPYYVVKSATAATFANADGFNGTVPSGYTTVAGINPTTFPRWSNYADVYSVVSKDDLVRKLRRAAEYADFMPLVDGESIDKVGEGYGFYTNYAVYGAMVEVAESQNDNLGSDIASMENRVQFRRTRMDWVPELNRDTTGPIYGIDWTTMGFVRLNGYWEKEIKVPLNPQQPTVASTHFVTRTNLLCTDRRKNFVLSTGTTMPA